MTKDFGYQLPTVINPDAKICFQILVPDDLYHLAAFRGQIWELTRWYNWAKDEDRKAIQVADVWKSIYEQLRGSEGCDPVAGLTDVRQNTDAPCTLEKSFDGITWLPFANLQKCPPRVRINAGIVQWLNPDTGIWEETDGGDERSDGSAPPAWPPDKVPVGEDGACLAAENIAAVWQSSLTELKAGLTIGRDVLAMTTGLAGAMGLFIPQAIISAIAQSIVLVVVQGGIAFVNSMLGHVQDFKCSVKCHIEGDGSVTAADFDAILADIPSWASGVELEVVRSWLNGFGSVGLTRQGAAAGITTGDCDDCECDGDPFQVYIWNDNPALEGLNHQFFILSGTPSIQSPRQNSVFVGASSVEFKLPDDRKFTIVSGGRMYAYNNDGNGTYSYYAKGYRDGSLVFTAVDVAGNFYAPAFGMSIVGYTTDWPTNVQFDRLEFYYSNTGGGTWGMGNIEITVDPI